jgi:subtilisin family serine protease
MRAAHPRRGRCGALLVALVMLGGCAQTRQPGSDTAALPKQLRQRQVVVTLAHDGTPVKESGLQAISSRYHLSEAGRFPLESIDVDCTVYDVPSDRSLDEVISDFRADPTIESAQLNQFFETAEEAKADPYGKFEYGAKAIHADIAHQVSTGKGVRVAVIDTGVNADHPDLRGRIAKVANFVDGGETSFATDRHGTAVAGIIGARADNGVGIFGIAPDSEIEVAKACWYYEQGDAKARCSSWTLAKAIDFAIREKASVLNLSLKGPSDPLLERLLLTAEARGITVVAAADDAGADPGFPARMASVIAVVSSDASGAIAQIAWLDKKFAVAAPGVDVITTVPTNAYDFVTGSSFSAAEVTGVVALVLERKPELAPGNIRALLRRSARPVTSRAALPSAGAAGLLDACTALRELPGVAACQ